MRYKLDMADSAEQDVQGTLTYLSQFYPSTPLRFKEILRKTYSNIKRHPYMYPECEDNTKYRRAVVGDYILLYTVAEEQKLVKIYRVLRGSWDLPEAVSAEEEKLINGGDKT
jgi:plasmid stabilization system protein ParE